MAFARDSRDATSTGRLFVGLAVPARFGSPQTPKNPSKRTNHFTANCVAEVIEATSTPTSLCLSLCTSLAIASLHTSSHTCHKH